MNNRDFDKVIDRRNTESYKWYGDNHGLDDWTSNSYVG